MRVYDNQRTFKLVILTTPKIFCLSLFLSLFFYFLYFWLSFVLVILFILISSYLLNSFTEFCGCNSLKTLMRQHSFTRITQGFNDLLHVLSAIVSHTKVDQNFIFWIFFQLFIFFRLGFCSRTSKKQVQESDVCALCTCFTSLFMPIICHI